MSIYNPFSKKQRKKKKADEKLARLCEQKSLSLCLRYEDKILNSNTSGVGNDIADEIIISLTSIKPRLDNIAYTIESLMQQTLKADRIILCLGKEQLTHEEIPFSLKLLEKRGLEIRFYEEDLGPYTKFFYTLKENPDSLILTVDDDILYPSYMIEKLYKAYLAENQYIHCHRGHKITVKENEIAPYKQWEYSTQLEEASKLVFPTGVGGVMYYPGSLDDEVLNKKVFMEICPKSDDIWLKAMSLKKGVLCKTINYKQPFSYDFPTIFGSQEITLKRSNKKMGGNNEKLKKVFEKYSLKSKLLEK